MTSVCFILQLTDVWALAILSGTNRKWNFDTAEPQTAFKIVLQVGTPKLEPQREAFI